MENTEVKNECELQKYVDIMTVESLQESIENVLEPLGFEVHPFKASYCLIAASMRVDLKNNLVPWKKCVRLTLRRVKSQ